MTVRERAPVTLEKPSGPRAEPARPSGSPWVMVPARVVALLVVVPVRLVWEALRAVVRSPLWLGRLAGRLLARAGRWLHARALRPVGGFLAWLGRGVWAGLSWCGRGIAWVWDRTVVVPLRWLFVTVLWGALRLFGRGSGRLGRWIWRNLLVPLGRVLNAVLVRPLAALLTGIGWLLGGAGRIIAAAADWLLNVLVVVPATALWRYALAPLFRGLGRMGRATGRFLAVCWHAFAAALAWSWRITGTVLYWLARVLLVLPATAVWRYLLRPLWLGVAWAWRIVGRGLRWMWRTLLVAPGRWVRDAVLRPVWRGTAATWRVLVREPLRWCGGVARDTGREVRAQLRQMFGRA
ncbi:hypothetical protein [Actinomadura kijaniata]|uniref:hypothetical protein n=1 Tax=Actinomadura kijaniata TaxID=46161 RepID=UPI000AEB707C|nr:hypothetical protein [Actinomadura kijaniata]